MTLKDYIEVAGVFRVELGQHDPLFDGHAMEAVARVAREMAVIFASDNHRFQKTRFFTACGLSEDGRIETGSTPQPLR